MILEPLVGLVEECFEVATERHLRAVVHVAVHGIDLRHAEHTDPRRPAAEGRDAVPESEVVERGGDRGPEDELPLDQARVEPRVEPRERGEMDAQQVVRTQAHVGMVGAEVVDHVEEALAAVVLGRDQVGVLDASPEGDLGIEVVDPVEVAEALLHEQDEAAGGDVLDPARESGDHLLGRLEDARELRRRRGPDDAVEDLGAARGVDAEPPGAEPLDPLHLVMQPD